MSDYVSRTMRDLPRYLMFRYVRCPKCGTIVDRYSDRCPKCGEKIK